MEQQKSSTSKLKVAVIILLLLCVGSFGYIYKLTNDSKISTINTIKVVDEKTKAITELTALKNAYDVAIAENTSLSDQLIVERDRIIALLEQLKKSDGSVASLSGFKQQYIDLNGKMKVMMSQVSDLTQKNSFLKTSKDSTQDVLNTQRISNQVLSYKNVELSKKIEKGSKLALLNLKGVGVKLKSSGKEIIYDVASKINMVRISFTVAENQLSKSVDKEYYVQVIDPNNNVIGDKAKLTFDSNILVYSFILKVSYNGKTLDLAKEINGKDFLAGTYLINIFDQKELISNSYFILK